MVTKPSIQPFDQVASVAVQNFESYLPTAFDDSLTLLEKVNKIIQWMGSTGQTVNSVIDSWNEVVNWVLEDGLYDEVTGKIDNLIADGTLAGIINNELLSSKADKTVVDSLQSNYNDTQTIANNSRAFDFSLLDFQSKIAETVTSIHDGDGSRYPQSAIVDKDNEVYYVARQTSGHYNDQRIYQYSLADNSLIKALDVPTAEWVYLEGLALYHNASGQPCFIIPTQRSGAFAVWNFATGAIEKNVTMEGSFKTAIDNNRKYFICSKHTNYDDLNNTMSGFLIYDLDSVVNGSPQLVTTVDIFHGDVYFPKTQTVTMIDDLLYCGQGAQYPAISVFDTAGNKVHFHAMDKQSVLQTIGGDTSQADPIMENEGIGWMEENGQTYPTFAYATQGKLFIVKMADLLGSKVKHSLSNEATNGVAKIGNNPIMNMLGDIGNAVLRVESDQDLYAEIFNQIGSDGYFTFFASGTATNTPLSSASLRGVIQVDRFINNQPDIFSIICQDYNGSVFANYYDANATPVWKGWSHIGGFSVDVLNSTTFDPLTANPGTYETKSGVNDPTGAGFGAIKEYRITGGEGGRRQILCFYNDNGHLYYASVATDGSKIGWYEINRTVIG